MCMCLCMCVCMCVFVYVRIFKSTYAWQVHWHCTQCAHCTIYGLSNTYNKSVACMRP